MKVEGRDLYGRLKTLNKTLERIRNSKEILPENKEKLLKFDQYCVVKGLSVARRANYLYTLETLSKMLGMPFEKANKEDIIKLVEKSKQIKNGVSGQRQIIGFA